MEDLIMKGQDPPKNPLPKVIVDYLEEHYTAKQGRQRGNYVFEYRKESEGKHVRATVLIIARPEGGIQIKQHLFKGQTLVWSKFVFEGFVFTVKELKDILYLTESKAFVEK